MTKHCVILFNRFALYLSKMILKWCLSRFYQTCWFVHLCFVIELNFSIGQINFYTGVKITLSGSFSLLLDYFRVQMTTFFLLQVGFSRSHRWLTTSLVHFYYFQSEIMFLVILQKLDFNWQESAAVNCNIQLVENP